MVGEPRTAYIPVVMDLLMLHGSGLGWDEALILIGGLAVLTAVLLARLGGNNEPVADEVQAERPANSPGSAKQSRRR
jgi:hypothetical protein